MARAVVRAFLPDKAATIRFGAGLADAIEQRAVIALIGPLGAGKTTIVQAVAQRLGIEEIVNSPTFTMLNEYHSGRLPLYHMDLYRLSESSSPAPIDLFLAEIEEFIYLPMVAMIEWAELLPAPVQGEQPLLEQLDHLVIDLRYNGNQGGARPQSQPQTPPGAGRGAIPGGVNQAADDLCQSVHINKDEDGRIASLLPTGEQSTRLLNRLSASVADMLIYS